jgi:hypothetical protein
VLLRARARLDDRSAAVRRPRYRVAAPRSRAPVDRARPFPETRPPWRSPKARRQAYRAIFHIHLTASSACPKGVPRLRWSSVHLAAYDPADATIAKPGTPFVRVDELCDQFRGMPGAPFTCAKVGFEHESASSARSASAASSIWRRPLRLLGDVRGSVETITFVGRANAK